MKRMELQETHKGWLVQWYVDGRRLGSELRMSEEEMLDFILDLWYDKARWHPRPQKGANNVR